MKLLLKFLNQNLFNLKLNKNFLNKLLNIYGKFKKF